MPPGVINMLPGDGLDVSAGRAQPPRPRRHPLHRLDADLPAPVGHGRREHRDVPLLPAHRRRDRRQGLHRRAPVGRPRRAAGRDDARRLRVPGPEVLGRLAGLRRPLGVEARSRTSSSPRPSRSPMGDVTDLSNFMGAVIDDRAFAKHKKAIARAKRSQEPRRPRRWPGRRLGRLLRPADDRGVQRPDRRDVQHRVLRPDPRGARLRRPPTSSTSWTRWSRSRRTP